MERMRSPGLSLKPMRFFAICAKSVPSVWNKISRKQFCRELRFNPSQTL